MVALNFRTFAPLSSIATAPVSTFDIDQIENPKSNAKFGTSSSLPVQVRIIHLPKISIATDAGTATRSDHRSERSSVVRTQRKSPRPSASPYAGHNAAVNV